MKLYSTFWVLLSLSSFISVALDTSLVNATEEEQRPLLPIFKNPVHVPGFLKNILGSPSFEDLSHWFWTQNTSKIEDKVVQVYIITKNQTVSLPPAGYVCNPSGPGRYWLCTSSYCELEQSLDVASVFFDWEVSGTFCSARCTHLQELGVEVTGTITALTSLWPEDYVSVNISATFWQGSDYSKLLLFESGLQPGKYITKLNPSSARLSVNTC
jgi:hypothetical protein